MSGDAHSRLCRVKSRSTNAYYFYQRTISPSRVSTYHPRSSFPLSCVRALSYLCYRDHPTLPVYQQRSYRNECSIKETPKIPPSSLLTPFQRSIVIQPVTLFPHYRMTELRSNGTTARAAPRPNLFLFYPLLHPLSFETNQQSPNLLLDLSRHLRTRFGSRNRFDRPSNPKRAKELSNLFDRGGARCWTILYWRYK